MHHDFWCSLETWKPLAEHFCIWLCFWCVYLQLCVLVQMFSSHNFFHNSSPVHFLIYELRVHFFKRHSWHKKVNTSPGSDYVAIRINTFFLCCQWKANKCLSVYKCNCSSITVWLHMMDHDWHAYDGKIFFYLEVFPLFESSFWCTNAVMIEFAIQWKIV